MSTEDQAASKMAKARSLSMCAGLYALHTSGQVRRGDSISSRFKIIEGLHSNNCTRRVPVSLLPIWDSSGAVSASIQTPEPAYRYLTQSLTLSVIGRGGRATQIVSIRLREVAS